LIACGPAKSNRALESGARKADTMVRDIPPEKDGRPNFWFPLVRDTEKQLGLDSLSAGVDSMEIRIWLGGGLARVDHSIVVKKDGQWNCRLYTYTINRNDNERDSLSEISTVSVPVDRSFIDSLIDLRILTLPNGPDGGLDGLQYCVQVATRNTYRFYSYWLPEEGKDHNSRDMADIMRLLKRRCSFIQF